jgi:hypothetical protein
VTRITEEEQRQQRVAKRRYSPAMTAEDLEQRRLAKERSLQALREHCSTCSARAIPRRLIGMKNGSVTVAVRSK